MADGQGTATASSGIVAVEDGGVLRLTMSNPGKKNAISKAMYRTLAKALDAAADTDSVRVVVIQGADGVFTSGNDVADFGGDDDGQPSAPFQFLYAITKFPKPIVAQVEGLAIGIGTTMLLHCDLVYAAKDARFQLPFVNLGLVPEAASSFLLPRLVGDVQAAELILLGEMFTAGKALELKLVNAILSPEELAAHVQSRAEALAAKAPNALRHCKALLRSPDKGGVPARLEEERVLFAEAIAGPEFAEALNAFLERRKPDFSKL